jgi:hypothetical protein
MCGGGGRREGPRTNLGAGRGDNRAKRHAAPCTRWKGGRAAGGVIAKIVHCVICWRLYDSSTAAAEVGCWQEFSQAGKRGWGEGNLAEGGEAQYRATSDAGGERAYDGRGGKCSPRCGDCVYLAGVWRRGVK